MQAQLQALKTRISDCLIRDQFRLRQSLSRIQSLKGEKADAEFTALEQAIEKSAQAVLEREQSVPAISYPEALPVAQKKADIIKAMAEHQVVIIAGETGSGKTTQLPKMCLELGLGRKGFIGHTQPRRLAARSVAQRIASELNTELGQSVGYKIRFSDNTSANSHIKLMTDGILLAEIQRDRFLNQYDTIIIDEAHERSLNIDFILGYLKNLLPKRPDLKVIITSATIDPERFSKHFNNAPIIEVSGRTYPVEVRYQPLESLDEGTDADQIDGIISASKSLIKEGPGDILVFLNGEREIRDTHEALTKEKLGAVEVLPLYSRLSNAEQNRIFASHTTRRIVLATNVAETSLTVPGIKYVIDPGTARISRYSYRTKVQRLPIEKISQASANQRKGRCGRVSAGICVRLYSEDDFNARPEFTDPEILRTNLASVIIQMLALGLGDMGRFPFVQAPDQRNITDGMRLLEELQAVLPAKGKKAAKLTATGKNIARLPIDPRLGKMILAANDNGALYEVIIIVAALSIQDPRERPNDKKAASDEMHQRFADPQSDFIAFLNLWRHLEEQQSELSRNQFRKRCQHEFLAYMRIREWQDIVYQITRVCQEMGMTVNAERIGASYEQIHQAILSGMLSHLGQKDDDKGYLGARQSKFFIFPGSSLFKKKPKWIMSAELVETSKLYGRINAKIEPQWAEALATHLVKKSYSEPHWEKKPGAVVAFEKQSLFGLPIVQRKKVTYSQIDPVVSRTLFIREALVNQALGRDVPFLKANLALIEQVQTLENKVRRRDILVDEDTLFDFYQARLPEHILTRASFNHWWQKASKQERDSLSMTKEDVMQQDASHITENAYPDTWQQGNVMLPLSYHFEPGGELDGVAVVIPLALLNQVHNQGFDWHIPAYRHELICGLIKSLPKTTRRNFVPAPNYADAVLASVSESDGPLLEVLATRLFRMTGVKVAPEEWDVSSLAAHLRMQFTVVDDAGKVLAKGTDLDALKTKLANQVTQVLTEVADEGIEQQGLSDFTGIDLPTEYVQQQGGYEIKAYPALCDEGQTVAVSLFDAKEKADAAQAKGLRKLILLNVPSPVKHLQQSLPNKAKLSLYFNPFGKVQDLINDCILAGIDNLIAEPEKVRTEETFTHVKERVRADINDEVVRIALDVEKVLTLGHKIHKKLKGKVDLTMITAHGDIKAQLESLVFKGFVTAHGAAKLPDTVRYLQAIEKRLEKLPVDPHRDKLCQLDVEKVQAAYDSLLSKQPKGMPLTQAVANVFWMIQELRVSLYAQTLKTPYPISAKRVLNAIKELENG